MTDHDELIEQGQFLRATGQGFLLEDDMREYERGLSGDHRFKAAKATGIGWRGHHEGLERFHEESPLVVYGVWLVVLGFACWAVVEIAKRVYG